MNPIVHVQSINEINSIHTISPNFLMINKPLVKVNSKKPIKTKRLIVWLDIKNLSDRKFNAKDLPAYVKLTDLKWQLFLNTKNGIKKLVPEGEKNDIVDKREYIIQRDYYSQVIRNDNCFIYEIDDTEDLNFSYNIHYKNTQQLGITEDGKNGYNKGNINIKSSDNYLIFNNAFAYNENSQNKLTVLSRDILEIVNKRELKAIDSLEKPILTLHHLNEEEKHLEIDKSQQLKAELDVIKQNGISYLDSDDKTLKIAQNGDTYEIYKTTGNHYDFQTNKWMENAEYKTRWFSKDKLKLNFKYDHQSFDIDWDIKDIKANIKTLRSSSEQLTKHITYSDIKPNTKFDTFIKNRETRLWK